jgi:transposase
VLRAREQDRPDVAEQRAVWRAEVMPGLDPERLVFVDETGAKTDMARSHGYAPAGQRLVDAVPYGRWHTTTFVAALRADGLGAPMAVDGAVNGELFLAYVRQVLVPELRPGDVVVMDNLGSHQVAGVREAIAGAGCRLLYLPPDSPDLNPIEQAFAKLKGLLRKAAERTTDGLWSALGRLLDRFSPTECRNYLEDCGYAAPPS